MGDNGRPTELGLSVPARPENVRVRPADRAVVVTWDRPSGGAAVTSYELTPCLGGVPLSERAASVDGAACSGLLRNLTNGTTYTVLVTPWNGEVAGPFVVSASVEPNPAPAPPTDVQAVGGEQSATVCWRLPVETGGPVERYRVAPSPPDTTPVEVMASQTSVLVPRLRNRTRYTFTVAAANGAGEGVSSPSNPIWVGDDVPRYLFPLELIYLIGLGLAAFLYALQYQPLGLDVPWLGRLTVPALRDLVPARIAGVPVSIPWFGALGAVLIGLYGIFGHAHRDWQRGYNMWHVARPLTGSALGAMGYIIFLAVLRATGVNLGTQDALGRYVYYAIAFAVGFREETFRQLFTRLADLLLGPGQPHPPAPPLPRP
jgi:hypothetical protein